jgi:hypothetical protein
MLHPKRLFHPHNDGYPRGWAVVLQIQHYIDYMLELRTNMIFLLASMLFYSADYSHWFSSSVDGIQYNYHFGKVHYLNTLPSNKKNDILDISSTV